MAFNQFVHWPGLHLTSHKLDFLRTLSLRLSLQWELNSIMHLLYCGILHLGEIWRVFLAYVDFSPACLLLSVIFWCAYYCQSHLPLPLHFKHFNLHLHVRNLNEQNMHAKENWLFLPCSSLLIDHNSTVISYLVWMLE